VSVPPVIVKLPAMVDAEPIERVPPERTMFAWLVRLLTESETPDEWVMVIPAVLITASSAEPGTLPVLQFEPTSQLPLDGLIQLTVLGSWRSSSLSRTGRKNRGFRQTSRLEAFFRPFATE
jgi:hypothetical protein